MTCDNREALQNEIVWFLKAIEETSSDACQIWCDWEIHFSSAKSTQFGLVCYSSIILPDQYSIPTHIVHQKTLRGRYNHLFLHVAFEDIKISCDLKRWSMVLNWKKNHIQGIGFKGSLNYYNNYYCWEHFKFNGLRN